jgi:hypothetical protein
MSTPSIPRCSSCRGWLPKSLRALPGRLCRDCRTRVTRQWRADLAALLSPSWARETAAAIRAARVAR